MENTGGNNMNQLNQFMKRYPKIALYSMITIAAAVVIIVIAAHSSVAVNASPDHENQKYFTTVQVNSGDTLWDLSQEYITSEYASVDDYIKEVEKILIENKYFNVEPKKYLGKTPYHNIVAYDLKKVHGQKRKLSSNIYAVRFIDVKNENKKK